MSKIAGKKTCVNWSKFQDQLVPGENKTLWQTAYNDYFFERLKTRYLNPVLAIEKSPDFNEEGEGFSIVAILCTLVEFLEATRQGKEFRYINRSSRKPVTPPFNPDNEYSGSQEYFINFLQNQKPFKDCFTSKILAEEFYTAIRCGLLHEAGTKKGWKIKVAKSRSNKLIDAEKKFVYRDNFREAFDTYFKIYEKELTSDIKLQKAFIKKFNSLCRD